MNLQDLQSIADRVRNVPHVQIVEGHNQDYGSHVLDPEQGTHTIRINVSVQKSETELLGILAHELTHAGLAELLETLYIAGTLNDATRDRITERAAYLADEIVTTILKTPAYIITP